MCQGTTDPMVSVAFVLGWRSGQAVRWPPPDDDGDDAPGLNTGARWAVLSGQIDEAQLRLEPHVSSLPSFGPQRPPESEDVYQRVLAKLYIAHDTFGKACRLGYLLEAFCCGAATSVASMTEIRQLLTALTRPSCPTTPPTPSATRSRCGRTRSHTSGPTPLACAARGPCGGRFSPVTPRRATSCISATMSAPPTR